jgi:hypothetical protein
MIISIPEIRRMVTVLELDSKRISTVNYSPKYTVTDLINALPGNSSVNTVKHATIKEAVFSVDPTDSPIDCLESDHVVCVYCR